MAVSRLRAEARIDGDLRPELLSSDERHERCSLLTNCIVRIRCPLSKACLQQANSLVQPVLMRRGFQMMKGELELLGRL